MGKVEPPKRIDPLTFDMLAKNVERNLGYDGVRMAEEYGYAVGWRINPAFTSPHYQQIYCVCFSCGLKWMNDIALSELTQLQGVEFINELFERFFYEVHQQCPHIPADFKMPYPHGFVP